ncbi:hypothetical protein SLS57_004107 [Botryosphaeria dothidea]
MIRYSAVPWFLAFASTAVGQNSERAIDPTGTQIGVNPVTVDMPTITYANIVYHSLVSEYVSVSGEDMSWKQGDTQHITATVTNIDGSSTATITQTAPVAAPTNENGDVDIIITPELESAFRELASSARTSAGCAAGLKGRDLASCGLSDFIDSVLKSDGVIKSADNALSSKPLLKASDIAELISTLKAGGALINSKFAVGAGVGAVAVWWFTETGGGTDPASKPIIPVANANMDKQAGAGGTPTAGCPPSAPTGKEAPICPEPDCVGKDNICQEGEWKYCKCIDLIDPISQPLSEDLLNQQQAVLEAVLSASQPEDPKATCSPNTNPYIDPIGMDILFAQNLAAVFCKGDTSKEMKADLTNKDYTGVNSKRSLLNRRTPPPSSSAYEGYTLHYEYSPGKSECSMDCTTAMKSLISQCEGIDHTVMQPAGSMELSCGAKYSYDIKSPEKEEPAPTPTPAIGPDGKSEKTNSACRKDAVPDSPGFDREKAIAAFAKLCKNELKGDKNGCIQSKDDGLFIKAAFTSDRDGSCTAYPFSMVDDEYTYKDGFEDMCKWALQSAMDDCNPDTTTNKQGGSNRLNCIDYTVYGFDKGAGVPDNDQCAWARG